MRASHRRGRIISSADVTSGRRSSSWGWNSHASKLVRVGLINGLPGFISHEADGELQTTALDIEDGLIRAIYVVRNPDKLRRLH